MKIGLLGGSFDPVHNGHIAMARAALTEGWVDRMVLIPAAQAPLKPAVAQASANHRLAMLRLAVADLPGVEVDDFEIRRGGVNYTIDTVCALRQRWPHDELFWIIGADHLINLPQWKDIETLVSAVTFLCASRPGYKLQPPTALAGLRWHRLDAPLWDVSSRELRARISGGKSLDGQISNNVIEYIERNHLYCRKPMITKPKTATTLEVLKTLVRAIDNKKAESLVVLNVRGKSNITDYLVLANGNSEPHLRAIRIEAEKVLDASGTPIAGMESGGYGSGWTVVDAYQIMLHIFTTEQRENYALDKLWKDAESLDIKKLLAEPKKAPVKKVTVKKVAAKKTAKKEAAKKVAVKKAATVKKTPAKKTAAKKVSTSKKIAVKKAVKTKKTE